MKNAVYVVTHTVSGAGDTVLGIFTDYMKAREFDLRYCKDVAILDSFEYTEIRKIELDKPYSYSDIAFGVGEVV